MSSADGAAGAGCAGDGDGGADVDGGADLTTFGCGDVNCRAPAEYCGGTEGPGGPFTNVRVTCASTPAMCVSDYTCACLVANGVSADNCIEADGGVTALIGLP
jgi:hypothetical protein